MAQKKKTTATKSVEPKEKNQEKSKPTGVIPQIVIHAQYIKDLSFENPNAPQILMDKGNQPEIEININVAANPQVDTPEGENRLFEVVLTIRATAKKDDKNMFIAELAYAAVISIAAELEDKALHPIILIEGPRLIFPFARAILAETTQNGGFVPLNIQPIDFAQVYRSGMKNQLKDPPAGNA
jgi:preprotein translocase subunit SecB